VTEILLRFWIHFRRGYELMITKASGTWPGMQELGRRRMAGVQHHTVMLQHACTQREDLQQVRPA
jgi:hypothetical protein